MAELDADVFLLLVCKVGLPVLEVCCEYEGKGGTSSAVVSNFATNSLKDEFLALSVGVDFAALALPY